MKPNFVQLLFLGIFFTVHAPLLAQQTFYVSPAGDDNHAGTQANPFATLSEAIQSAQKSNASDITIHLQKGVYYLNQPIIISAEAFQGKRLRITAA